MPHFFILRRSLALALLPVVAGVSCDDGKNVPGIANGGCPAGSVRSASESTCLPGTAAAARWLGSDTVRTADGSSAFGANLSGLTYEGARSGAVAVLWAVRNSPGALLRLVSSGGSWTPDAAAGWSHGRALRYPDGSGSPDAEGVTLAAGGAAEGVFVAAERNTYSAVISRNSILRYDVAAAGATLRATHEWNLTADLPAVGPNLGIEAISWVPDSMLVANGFHDESKGRAYAPSEYPNHGSGLFFVGLEANGSAYGYALNFVTSAFTRVATITTGLAGVMGMEYDRATGYLWAICDDGCSNMASLLEIDTRAASATLGRFRTTRRFERPATMPNINNEGFALAPASECVANRKPAFWADDNETAGHALRAGSIPCGTITAAGTGR